MYLYAYTLLLIIMTFYPSKIGNTQSSDENAYVPKSKRGITHRVVNSIREKLRKYYDKIIGIDFNPKIRRRTNCKMKGLWGIWSQNRERRNPKHGTITAAAVVAMSAGHDRRISRKQRQINFDSDAESIGIDNRCSACLSHKIEDFIGTPRESKRTIKGYGGTKISNVMTGTIKWKWLDDNGGIHEFKIPNSYYVPEGNVRLISPQHWAQSQRNQFGKNLKYGCDTQHDKMVLYWNNETSDNRLTVPISDTNNVATFELAPGFNKFTLFCEEAKIDYESELISPSTTCMSVEMSNLNDHEKMESTNAIETNWPKLKAPINESLKTGFSLKGEQGKDLITSEDRMSNHKVGQKKIEAELLEIHQKYGHVSFYKLIEMAKQGIINKKYQRCRIPVCSTCMFAKATRKRWRDKPIAGHEINRPNQPGEKVSVDQLVSPTPGLVAQMTGKLTTKRYRYATVYVDQATGYGYVHLQKTATAEETIEGKLAFEDMALRHGVMIKGYHADNGIFKARKWVEACRSKQQILTFAGVNAHHQNGIAERRIRTLQEMARAMMIHAHKRWPAAITPNLWPYAVKIANDSLNETPNMGDTNKRSSIQLFSNTNVQPNPKHAKTFGSPVYVLDNSLQSGSHLHKWSQRSKVGIYLGRSPQHSRNVALVLDRMTGLVSPQFHVSHDNNFETVTQEQYDSKWQSKAGFVSIVPKRKLESYRTQREVRKKRVIQEPIDERDKSNATSKAAMANDERSKRLERRNALKQSQNEATPEGGPVIEKALNELDQKVAMQSIDEVFAYEISDMMDDIDPLYAYKAVADPDVMYLHQAMRERDKEKFIEAMRREVHDQSKNGNFTIIKRDKMPEGKKTLKSVWQMRRKRDIRTRKVKKYKARLNIDGSRMVQGIDYDETYAPVASWRTIRLILTMALVNRWHTRQIDYILAFPQAPVERDLYMVIPKGLDIENGKSDDYVLKINKNIYGQKQAGRVWNQYLVNKLVNELGFVQSKIDECLFYRGKVMYALYTDDSIIAGPDKKEIDELIQEMRNHKLDITDEGDITDFLGVNIENMKDGTIKLSQPHLVDQILKDLRLDGEDVKIKPTPAASSRTLSRHPTSPKFDGSFHYRSVIGKLNYLEKCTRPDISYAAHQCARFTEDPKLEHGKAVRWLGRYLKGTRDKGIIFRPIKDKDLEVYVDADFVGNWTKEEANDRDNARSRHGYIIQYNGCPILWKSQLQGEIALSSTESEYMGISYSLRDTIPIMATLDEMMNKKFPIRNSKGKVRCRLFEDNSGALEMAKVHKYRPRTKHINAKYHHFRDFVTNGQITLHPIDTGSQPADMLTKPLNENVLKKHRAYVMGW